MINRNVGVHHLRSNSIRNFLIHHSQFNAVKFFSLIELLGNPYNGGKGDYFSDLG